MRGLKLLHLFIVNITILSHPSWMRGLKQVASSINGNSPLSHPSWMRGLKLNGDFLTNNLYSVASFVDAWIETSLYGSSACPLGSRILRGCVD